MGYYIDKDSKGNILLAHGKARALILDGGEFVGTGVIDSSKFTENLVCCVTNMLFDAAAYAYSMQEFEAFNDPDDPRPRVWLIHPQAKKLSGYKEVKNG